MYCVQYTLWSLIYVLVLVLELVFLLVWWNVDAPSEFFVWHCNDVIDSWAWPNDAIPVKNSFFFLLGLHHIKLDHKLDW